MLILSIGSNLGNKVDNINYSISKISEKIGSVVKISSFFETEPVDFVSRNQFVNVVVIVKTKLRPYRILKITQKIEKLMGREQKTQKGIHFDRIIDIDIVAYNNFKISSKTLSIPHPKALQRNFVLDPLKEISPKYFYYFKKYRESEVL